MKDSHEGAASNTRGVEESARKAQEKMIIYYFCRVFPLCACLVLHVVRRFVVRSHKQRPKKASVLQAKIFSILECS